MRATKAALKKKDRKKGESLMLMSWMPINMLKLSLGGFFYLIT
jgi:hypothetical protein